MIRVQLHCQRQQQEEARVVGILLASVSLSSLLPPGMILCSMVSLVIPWLISCLLSASDSISTLWSHTCTTVTVDCIPERYRQSWDSTPHCTIICLASHSALSCSCTISVFMLHSLLFVQRDKGFDRSTFEKQMAVMRGQVRVTLVPRWKVWLLPRIEPRTPTCLRLSVIRQPDNQTTVEAGGCLSWLSGRAQAAQARCSGLDFQWLPTFSLHSPCLPRNSKSLDYVIIR